MLARMNCSLTDAGPTNFTSTRSIFGPVVCAHAADAQPSNSQIPKRRRNNFIGYRSIGTSSSLTLAALSNRVYDFKNVKFTSPVGPLRCLAINRFTGTPSGSPRRRRRRHPRRRSACTADPTTSASCSIAPDSRKSDNRGLRLLSRSSSRFNWLKHKHRHLQFLRQRLDAAGNVRNFLLPVFLARRAVEWSNCK